MTGPNPAVLMANFTTLADILQAVSILMGLGLFVGGVFVLKRWGEMRTFMSYQLSLAWPLGMMICGVFLIALPTVISTGVYALWSQSSALRYTGTDTGWGQYMPPLLLFVRLIGVDAIIRGILLFSRTGSHNSQPGMVGKGFGVYWNDLCVSTCASMVPPIIG